MNSLVLLSVLAFLSVVMGFPIAEHETGSDRLETEQDDAVELESDKMDEEDKEKRSPAVPPGMHMMPDGQLMSGEVHPDNAESLSGGSSVVAENTKQVVKRAANDVDATELENAITQLTQLFNKLPDIGERDVSSENTATLTILAFNPIVPSNNAELLALRERHVAAGEYNIWDEVSPLVEKFIGGDPDPDHPFGLHTHSFLASAPLVKRYNNYPLVWDEMNKMWAHDPEDICSECWIFMPDQIQQSSTDEPVPIKDGNDVVPV